VQQRAFVISSFSARCCVTFLYLALKSRYRSRSTRLNRNRNPNPNDIELLCHRLLHFTLCRCLTHSDIVDLSSCVTRYCIHAALLLRAGVSARRRRKAKSLTARFSRCRMRSTRRHSFSCSYQCPCVFFILYVLITHYLCARVLRYLLCIGR